jgi:LPS export ABC transporter permease LptG
MPFPRRVTRSVLAEVFRLTLLGMAFFSFLLLTNNFFLVAQKALSKNLSADLTERLFLTFLPQTLVLAIPMSVLFGCLLTVGRISADQEWTALQGAGQGPWSLLKPILSFGLLASLASMYVYWELVPKTNYTRRSLSAEIILSSSLAADLKPRTFYSEMQDTVLYVEDILAGSGSDDGSGRLRGVVFIRNHPKRDEYDVVLARSGDIFPVADRSGALLADLHHGSGVRYSLKSPDPYYLLKFESHREPIPPPPYLKSLLEPPNKVVSDMVTRELLDQLREARHNQAEAVEQLRAQGRDPEDRQARFLVDNAVIVSTVELHARLALPLASLFLGALAMPLGITRARSGKGAGLAVCIVVIAIYWLTYTFARNQSIAGKIAPWLGPWLANLAMAPWAAWLLWRMRRPRDTSGAVSRLLHVYRAIRNRWISRRRPSPDPVVDTAPEETLQTLSGTSNRFVIRIDSYVGLHYLRVLLYAVVLAYSITFLVQLKSLAEGLLRTQQSPLLLVDYFKYFAPSMLHIVLPISCLLGAVVAYTLLARSGELTAVKATGMSVFRVTLPVVVLTALLCVFLYFVEDFVAPSTSRKAQEAEDRIMGRAPQTYSASIGGRWGLGPNGNTLYHFRLFDADKQEFQGLNVFTIDRSEPRIVDHLFAQRARWNGDTAELEQGWYRDLSLPETYQVFDKMEKTGLDPPPELLDKQLTLGPRSDLAEQMSLEELDDEIESLAERGYDTTHLQMAFHGKLARSAAPLVMVLLGLPFAFRVGRRGSLYGVGVALLLVLVYWAVFAVFNALGLETLLEPWAAAWAPNVLFGLLGTYLLLYVPT